MSDLENQAEVKLVSEVVYKSLRQNFPLKSSFYAAEIAKEVGLNVKENVRHPYPTTYEISDFASGLSVNRILFALLSWLSEEEYVYTGDSVTTDVVLTEKGLNAFKLKPNFIPGV